MTLSLRSFVVSLHRWTGLTIGVAIVILAITGAILAARPQLEQFVERDLKVGSPCVNPLPLDALAAAAVNLDKSGINYVRLDAANPEVTAMVRFRDNDSVYVDRCTGVVNGRDSRYGGFFGMSEQLHKLSYKIPAFFTAKFNGTTVSAFITGTSTAVLIVSLVVGGAYIWWPRRRSAWKSALALNPALKGRAFSLNLHSTIGVYTSLVVLVSALTGMVLVFKWPRHLLYVVSASNENSVEWTSKLPDSKGERAQIEGLWQRMQVLDKNIAVASIYFPNAPADPVTIYTIDRGAPHAEARNYAHFDAYSGELLRFDPYESLPRGKQLYYWGLAIHTGQVGGLLVDLLMLAGCLGIPVLAYTGVDSYCRKAFRRVAASPSALPAIQVRVASIEEQGEGIKVFKLVGDSNKPLPAFVAGSHINVVIEDGLVRQYSLCNGPADKGHYLIAVKREEHSRGGSQAMHESVRAGDRLVINAPRCNFPLIANARDHLLVAGGIGITPLLSMARHLNAAGSSWSLHYFVRSPDAAAFRDALQAPGFASRVVIHEISDLDRLRLTVRDLVDRRRDGAHLYMCGPKPFMQLVEEEASSSWTADSIHIEHFSPHTVLKGGSQNAFEIELTRSGRVLPVPAGASIAEVLAANRVAVMTSCEQGICGSCVVDVLDGTPDHHDTFLTAEEHHAGNKMTVCVSRAKSSRLVLDL